MHLSSGTGRLDPPKIEVRCSCGKRYRVPATKAGKKVRCKNCRLKIRVPNPAGDSKQISMRTRKAILAEFGIDADLAARAYEVEKEQGYVCALCAGSLAEDELKAAYGEDGLVCSTCRASLVSERQTGDPSEKKKEKKKLDRWTRKGDNERVKKKALGMGALFLVGTAGFVHSIFAPSVLVTALVSVVVAGLGARQIYTSEYEPEDDE